MIDITPVTRIEHQLDGIVNDSPMLPDPFTRIELMLEDIKNGVATALTPITRIEFYLAKISGADVAIPAPVTRIETFLAIIAGGDYEAPEPATRLEGLLAEWVEKGAGFWKTVTGTLIHLTDALPSPVKELSVAIDSDTGATGCEVYNTPYLLPNEYQACEYVESTGTQYIDTGIECTSDLVVDFKAKATASGNAAICGGIDTSNGAKYFRHHCSPYNYNFYWIQNDSAGSASVQASGLDTSIVTVVIDPTQGTAAINGVSKTFTALPNNLTTGKSYGLFARISDTGAIQYKASRIYYFKFYRNSQLIGYFVPCYRKSDNVVGMYDFVSKTFFTNNGTGTFSKGNDIVAIPETTCPISWQTEAGSITSGTLTIDENGGVTLESGGNTYNLTSITPIETLAGENNIWVDVNGEITLTYKANA